MVEIQFVVAIQVVTFDDYGRHSSWLIDSLIYVYGGFELDSPNIPTD